MDLFQYAFYLIIIAIIALIYYPFGMKFINNKLSIEQKSFLLNCQSPSYLVLSVIIALLSWPVYYSLIPTADHPSSVIFSTLIFLIGIRRINIYAKLKKQGFEKKYLYMYAINSLILLVGLAFLGISFSFTPPYYHKHTIPIKSVNYSAVS